MSKHEEITSEVLHDGERTIRLDYRVREENLPPESREKCTAKDDCQNPSIKKRIKILQAVAINNREYDPEDLETAKTFLSLDTQNIIKAARIEILVCLECLTKLLNT